MRFARATVCGLAGLLLGGQSVAILAVMIVPFVLTALTTSMERTGIEPRTFGLQTGSKAAWIKGFRSTVR